MEAMLFDGLVLCFVRRQVRTDLGARERAVETYHKIYIRDFFTVL